MVVSEEGRWYGTAPFTRSHQWLRCNSAGNACLDIVGETGPMYTLAAPDVGNTVKVRETAQNAFGSASAASNPSRPIAPDPHVGEIPEGGDIEESIPPDAVEDAADGMRPLLELAGGLDGLVPGPARIQGRCVPAVGPVRRRPGLRVKVQGLWKCTGAIVHMTFQVCIDTEKRGQWVDLGCSPYKQRPGPGLLTDTYKSAPCIHDTEEHRFRGIIIADAKGPDRNPGITLAPYVIPIRKYHLYC